MAVDEGSAALMSAAPMNSASCCKVFKDLGASKVEAVRNLSAPVAAWVHPSLKTAGQLNVPYSTAARLIDPFQIDSSPPDRSAFSVLLI
ncbi:MAG: hypothetical protein ABIW19_13270 [Vicinamibacterales bacterium]